VQRIMFETEFGKGDWDEKGWRECFL